MSQRLIQLDPIHPMEPQSTQQIPDQGEWIAQIKWDGVRIVTYVDDQGVRLYNRKINERTQHYPEITSIKDYCSAQSVILDGEVIAMGDDGKPSFHEVMRRDGLRRLDKVRSVMKQVPIHYMIFDVLFHDGKWVIDRPWQERNEILQRIIRPTPVVQVVDSKSDARSLYQAIQQHGMEGIVLKKNNSPYLLGEKKDIWLKLKNYRDLIAVIGGFTLRGGVVNAILLGLYDADGRFWYIGHSGTGRLTASDWRELTALLQPLVTRERPFQNKPERQKDAYWVSPVVTVKIQFAEWTEGRSLRQPSIQAITDIDPSSCILEGHMRR